MKIWFIKKRNPLEELDEHTKRCIAELKHTSAYDLLTRATRFNKDLDALLVKHEIPHVVAAGVLLETAINECTQEQQIRNKNALVVLTRYIDEHCMKKEPLTEEEKHHA